MLPTVVTPLPPVVAAAADSPIHADPLYTNEEYVPARTVTECMVKSAVPMLLTYTILPAVVTVGDGRLRVWPVVVWLTLKLVATSTLFAAVSIAPPDARLDIDLAVNRLDEALVKVEPVFTVRPLLAVNRPPTVVAPVLVT